MTPSQAPRVLVLYTEPVLPAGHPDAESEADILETVAAVAGHLERAGLNVSRLGVQRDPALLVLDEHNGLRTGLRFVRQQLAPLPNGSECQIHSTSVRVSILAAETAADAAGPARAA